MIHPENEMAGQAKGRIVHKNINCIWPLHIGDSGRVMILTRNHRFLQAQFLLDILNKSPV